MKFMKILMVIAAFIAFIVVQAVISGEEPGTPTLQTGIHRGNYPTGYVLFVSTTPVAAFDRVTAEKLADYLIVCKAGNVWYDWSTSISTSTIYSVRKSTGGPTGEDNSLRSGNYFSPGGRAAAVLYLKSDLTTGATVSVTLYKKWN